MAGTVEVKAEVVRGGRGKEVVLTCFDPQGVLRHVRKEEVVRNLWRDLGPGWWQAPEEAFILPYALGERWQGIAHFTVLTRSATGGEYTGEWRLGDSGEIGALWQAERVRRFVGDEWRDLWELYIAPGDLTPGLEYDIVGLRRLALPVSAWLDIGPAVGDMVSFAAGNLYIGRPPARNFYPLLRGWGERSIYERMRLTGRSAF